VSAAVTIDVDGVRHYHAIHGLPEVQSGVDPVLVHGLRRFLDLCKRHALRATVFIVTRDLEEETFADLVREAARAGHEIASHSHAHLYDLSRRAPAEIQADVLRSRDALARVVGVAPAGFRAPGYNLSEDLLDALERAGFAYDSSLMPSPAYFAARAAAIAAHKASGRRSASIVGRGRAFFSPRSPYRPRRGSAHKRARSRVEGRDLLELPIATGPAGVPFFGTTLTQLPLPLGVSTTALALARDPCVLELHAIDLCDAADGFDPRLVRLQRDLRVPLARKLARLDASLRMLCQVGAVIPLVELAAAARTE
jgi:peptidoglycan-N-acetylglucosamine deacetylase